MTSEELSQYLNADIELVEQALEKLEAEGLVQRTYIEEEEEDEATDDDFFDPSIWENK